MPAKPVTTPRKPGISAYPDDATREAIARMAEELSAPEGRIIALCAEAVAEMIAGPKLVVPRFVTMLWAVRKQRMTMLDAPKPWPKADGASKRGG